MASRKVALVNYATLDAIPASLKKVGVVVGNAPAHLPRVSPNWVNSKDEAPASQVCYGAVQYPNLAAVPPGILAMGLEEYITRVLELGPIAYWPLDEASGTVAYDRSGNGLDGSYTDVALGAAGIGDGRTCPTFEGNDYATLFSAGLASAFSFETGSVSLWFYLDPAGLGTTRQIFYATDATGKTFELRADANASFNWIVRGSSVVTKYINYYPRVAGWVHLGVTWDIATTTCRFYIGGYESRVPMTNMTGGHGALTGLTYSLAGSAIQGRGAHPALWARVLSASEMLALAYNDGRPIAFDGDSRTFEKSYPATAYLTAKGALRCGYVNVGASGATTTNMVTNAPTNVDAKLGTATGICVVWGGVNDGNNLETTKAKLQEYCLARRAAGHQVIVCTEIDGQDATRNAYDWHGTYYPALNTWLRENYATFADGLADLGGNAALQDATNLTYYNADKVHLTDAGYEVVASIVAPIIAGLL